MIRYGNSFDLYRIHSNDFINNELQLSSAAIKISIQEFTKK